MLTSIGGSRFAEAVAVSLLERGAYRKYLERLRRRMRDALGSTVQTLEDAGWEVFEKPVGGKFVWARVPHVADAGRLVACGAPLGVTVAPGNYFRPRHGSEPVDQDSCGLRQRSASASIFSCGGGVAGAEGAVAGLGPVA